MLSDVYFPRVNGVSTSIRTYARALQAMGHRVTLVAPGYGASDAVDEPFEIVRVPARTIFFDPEDRLMRADALRRVERELARRRFDVVHIHTPFRAHRLGVRLARRMGWPTVETYHTYFEAYVAHYLPWAPAGALQAFARWASRRLCGEVDHLIVPTRDMAGVLERYGIRTPSTVLPTGIDLTEFAGGDASRFRRQHGIAGGRPVLLTVSRLAVEKNIAFLLRAMRHVAEAIPDALLVITGEGPDAERLQALAASLGLHGNVRFFGYLDRGGALLDCYRAADLFVFASPTETQGLVLIEAMALGVPILSTAVLGTRAVLEGAESAQISEEDEHAFAAHAIALLRDPVRRAAMAERGAADARRWSADALMRQAEALYASLAGDAAQVARMRTVRHTAR